MGVSHHNHRETTFQITSMTVIETVLICPVAAAAEEIRLREEEAHVAKALQSEAQAAGRQRKKSTQEDQSPQAPLSPSLPPAALSSSSAADLSSEIASAERETVGASGGGASSASTSGEGASLGLLINDTYQSDEQVKIAAEEQAEKAARQQAEQLAKEQAAKEQAAKEQAEKAVKELAEQLSKEQAAKAAKEQAEKDLAEKEATEQADAARYRAAIYSAVNQLGYVLQLCTACIYMSMMHTSSFMPVTCQPFQFPSLPLMLLKALLHVTAVLHSLPGTVLY